MTKAVVLAEKPQLARDIADALNVVKKGGDGYYENDNYIITWAFGHLLGLKHLKEYDNRFGRWDKGVLTLLPWRPQVFERIPIGEKSAKKQLKIITELFNRKDVDYIINACDAGLEGEYIFRLIYEYSKCRKPIKRLWISSQTDEAIKEGFRKLKDGSLFDNLAQAGYLRAESDFLLGGIGTMAYTAYFGTFLSVGRVQTATLYEIVKREEEIENFKPENYYELMAYFKTENNEIYQGKYFRDKINRFKNRKELEEVWQKIQKNDGKIISYETKQVKKQPPLLYDLTELQKDCNKKYGFSAEETLNLAQELYEKHKILSYPRTSCRFLSKDIVGEIPKILTAIEIGEYKDKINEVKGFLDLKKIVNNKMIVNETKLTDHHALIPTTKKVNINVLSEKQKKVFDLVVKRFLAVFYPAAELLETEIVTAVLDENFKTTGKTMVKPGWFAVYGQDNLLEEEKEEEKMLPVLKQEDIVSYQKGEIKEGKTSPPKRYTEADLLNWMKNAGKKIENKELKEVIKDVGIGTPATRAGIIQKLFDRDYLVREKRFLKPTNKGRQLVKFLEEVKSPLLSVELTAIWSKNLKEVEYGEFKPEQFEQGVNEIYENMINQLKNNSKGVDKMSFNNVNAAGKCPVCGKDIVERKEFYGCLGYKDGCKFTISKTIAGKKLTESQIKTLLSKGKTGKIKGFKSKAGKDFEAMLAIEDGKVVFKFS